ncbi:outer membrane beta-barrel protein [Flammeovirga sp. EKP202]|uniref:outer membrane beta-barrel protein n=1 Tax=Flammeovirga sp. EKP202 TaxID=2770592 RepID=UPI00165FFE0B|nr:outer membrane beta-barrel protein [Flammeovirga sp. EKP202]MBD0401639.1 outer membrane beta-barrel protein [Flammeovirga sp. EKP202]
MKKINLFFCFLLFSLCSFGQKIPGNFYLDFGATMWQDDKGLELETQSRSISLAYMYELVLDQNGQFTFNPGVGYTADNYFLKNGVTLYNNGSHTEPVGAIDSNQKLRKSKLVGNYVDVPLEFRFRNHPGRNAFRLAVGARLSLLVDGHTKVKYEDEFGNVRVSKDKGNFNLNRFKAGLVGRIGYGWINFFCYYGLTNTFESDKLLNTDGNAFTGTDRPITIGITVSNF